MYILDLKLLNDGVWSDRSVCSKTNNVICCIYLNFSLLSTACHVIPFCQYIFIRETSLFVFSIPVLLLLSLKPFTLSLFVSLTLNLSLPLMHFVSLHLTLFFLTSRSSADEKAELRECSQRHQHCDRQPRSKQS